MKGELVIVPEGAHAELGASSSERWIECGGSVLASRGVKDIPSSYALEGTAAHTVSEWVRLGNMPLRASSPPVPAEAYKGVTLRIARGEEHWDVKCGKAMVLSVQRFCDRVAKLPGHELVEKRLDYSEYVPGGFGTSDTVKLNDGICYVGDFKHGTGVKKDADMNTQLLLYALGTYLTWSWAYEFDTFNLRIYQPRLNHYPEAEITLKRLLEWANDVARPMALRALKPGAPLKSGSWCQFCKVKKTCAVRSQYRRERDTASRMSDFQDLDAA